MVKKHPSGWGKIVPHFYKFEWEEFTVSAKPIGKRRWKFLSWLPYFSGNAPTFRVSISATPDESRQLEAHLRLLGNTGDEITRWPLLSRPDTTFKNVDEDIKLHPIATGGDHSLKIQLVLPHAKLPKSVERDLVTFRAIVQETITLLVVATLLTFLGAVVGGLIVHFLFGGQPN